MRLKRAILISVAAYAASFVVGLLTAAVLGFDPYSTDQTIPESVWYVGIISTFVIGFVFAWWYLKPSEVEKSPRQGLWFALVAIAVGLVVDWLMIGIYVLSGGDVAQFIAYYSDPYFWLSIVALLVGSVLAGFWVRRGNAIKK